MTSRLTINPVMAVSRKRRLPIAGTVLVHEGESVSADTIVARTEVPGYPVPVNIASKLEIEPHEIVQVMQKKVGDRVAAGEVLATRKRFVFAEAHIESPIDGTVEDIAPSTGVVTLCTHPVPVSVLAHIPGKVAGILSGEGAVIETEAAYLEGVIGFGGERHGRLCVLSQPGETLFPAQVTSDLKERILVVGAALTHEILLQAIRAQVSGIICASIDDETLNRFVGYDIPLPLTGQEKVPMTLIVTEGFGCMAMAEERFSLLKSLDGCMASITGATHIRAKVTRPEIIVVPCTPVPATVSENSPAAEKQVRIMRDPYLGKTGWLAGEPMEGYVLPSGISTTAVNVRLDDGSEVMVATANIEAI